MAHERPCPGAAHVKGTLESLRNQGLPPLNNLIRISSRLPHLPPTLTTLSTSSNFLNKLQSNNTSSLSSCTAPHSHANTAYHIASIRNHGQGKQLHSLAIRDTVHTGSLPYQSSHILFASITPSPHTIPSQPRNAYIPLYSAPSQ